MTAALLCSVPVLRSAAAGHLRMDLGRRSARLAGL